jgi:hypothetical protein
MKTQTRPTYSTSEVAMLLFECENEELLVLRDVLRGEKSRYNSTDWENISTLLDRKIKTGRLSQ